MQTQTTVDQQVAEAKREETLKLQNQAYNAAWARIRQKYRDEYDAAVDEEFAKRGLARNKRATHEEREERLQQERIKKATAQLNKLLERNPELKEQFNGQPQG